MVEGWLGEWVGYDGMDRLGLVGLMRSSVVPAAFARCPPGRPAWWHRGWAIVLLALRSGGSAKQYVGTSKPKMHGALAPWNGVNAAGRSEPAPSADSAKVRHSVEI